MISYLIAYRSIVALYCKYNLNRYTIFYWLIAAATITFTKTSCVATKWGRLLNISGQPEQRHLYSTYVAKSLGMTKLQTLISYRTYSCTATPSAPPYGSLIWLPNYLMMTNKIKLVVPGSVNKCHVVHTDMAGGDSAGVCDCSTWVPLVLCCTWSSMFGW